MGTGDLPGLFYRYIDDLIVFNKKFLDYLKKISRPQLTVEKANKSDHLANYLSSLYPICKEKQVNLSYSVSQEKS